jgi:integrase
VALDCFSDSAGRNCNPASSVRGPKHSIDTSTVIGLRDRAFIGVMVYSFARVSAVCGMRLGDFYQIGRRTWIRLHEKGGKFHEVPAHHNACDYLDAYLKAAGLEGEKTPLFRSTRGRSKKLTDKPMSRVDVFRMIRRRALAAGLSAKTCCHTFRATGLIPHPGACGNTAHS